MRVHSLVAATILSAMYSFSAQAGNLTYQPVIPAFGGNVLYGSVLMSEAQAQDHFTAPAPPSSGASIGQPLTPAQLFASQLQSELLSSLASQINNAIFGPNAVPSGKFVYGTETITFNRTLTDVSINITDSSTGQTTQVQVPLVQVAQ